MNDFTPENMLRSIIADIQMEGFQFTQREVELLRKIGQGQVTVSEARNAFHSQIEHLRIYQSSKIIDPSETKRDSADPYQYKLTSVLINKLGINDHELLAEAERNFTAFRMIELWENPVRGKFDFEHLKAIHRVIFQDIFPWAGESRKVDFIKGGTVFCLVIHLNNFQQDIFNRLKQNNYLKDLEPNQFIQLAAALLGDLNALHPFREGNGRTQREFLRELGREAGYWIDFSNVSQNEDFG